MNIDYIFVEEAVEISKEDYRRILKCTEKVKGIRIVPRRPTENVLYGWLMGLRESRPRLSCQIKFESNLKIGR